jgi:hypothetical protein
MHPHMHIIFKMSSVFDAFWCNILCIFVAVLCNILCILYAILCINAYIMHDMCGILRGNFNVVVILLYIVYIGIQGIYSFAPHILKVNFYSLVILFLNMCDKLKKHLGEISFARNLLLIKFIICPYI